MTVVPKARGLVLLAAIALAACGDKAVTGGNATAPGSPGTGNATTTATPLASDSQAGGSSGMVGSAPVPGTSGGDAGPGVTGRGTSEIGGRSAPAQAGVGTTGGLGGNFGLGMTGSFPAVGASNAARTSGAAAAGSTSSTPDNAVGRR